MFDVKLKLEKLERHQTHPKKSCTHLIRPLVTNHMNMVDSQPTLGFSCLIFNIVGIKLYLEFCVQLFSHNI